MKLLKVLDVFKKKKRIKELEKKEPISVEGFNEWLTKHGQIPVGRVHKLGSHHIDLYFKAMNQPSNESLVWAFQDKVLRNWMTSWR